MNQLFNFTANQIDRTQLQQTINAAFNDDELRQLCFDLNIEYDDLRPGGRSDKARELIQSCLRHSRLPELVHAVLLARPHIPPHTLILDKSDNAPFQGLRYFDEKDADWFFGRDEQIAKLAQHLQSNNFLAVVGASGSGKSSLVRAGLIPAIRQGELTDLLAGCAHWPIHIITPTANPIKELATTLTRDSESVTATATLMDDMRRDSRSLDLYVNRLVGSGDKRLLLLIDQFEELFTLCKDGAERDHFVANLVAAAAVPGRTTLIVTLRADFYPQCLQYESLHQLLEEQQKIVPPMSPEELREAIEAPARKANLRFEAGLVDLLLRDVGDEPGALPLLSHALLETWRRREGDLLTLAGYTAAGGVRGAIAKTADDVYGQIDAAQQKIARNIFLRLTELGEGTQDTRRRAKLTELLPSAAAEAEAVQAVMQLLANARLVTTDEESAEVAHEALIREWPSLRDWLDADRDGLRLHRQLTAAAQIWHDLEQDPDALYRGVRLQQAQVWATENEAQLNELETAFLQASQAAVEAEERAREEARQRELEQAKRLAEEAEARRQAETERAEAQAKERQRAEQLVLSQRQRVEEQEQAAVSLRQRLIYVFIALAVAIVLGIVAVFFGISSSQNADLAITREVIALANEAEAQRQSKLALAQSVAALSRVVLDNDNDKELATLLAIEAAKLNGGAASNTPWLVNETLRQTLTQPYFNNSLWEHDLFVESVTFSPDGETLASGSTDGTIRLWDLNDPSTVPQVLRGHESRVRSVTFSPDGETLASGSTDGTIRLWDLSEPSTEPQVLQGHGASVGPVTFSPDGETLASGTSDGIIQLRDLDDPSGSQTLRVHQVFGVASVAFSPDGETLASGIDDIILWDLTDRSAEPQVLRGHENWLASVAFSPDGETLASGSSDGTIRLWDLNHSSAAPQVLRGHESSVGSVAFAPDGATLASGSDDRTIRLWDMSDRSAEPQVLRGHESWVGSVAFAPDGQRLASGSDDITLWDLTEPRVEPQVLRGHESYVNSVTFSPDGETLASGSSDGTIWLWDLNDPSTEPQVLQGFEDWVLSVVFSLDGETLAAGSGGVFTSEDSIIRLWDLSDLSTASQFLQGHEDRVSSVVLSPDGTTLASGSDDGTIRLWDMSDPQAEPQVLRGHESGVGSVAFSPDGASGEATLASGSGDGTIRLWDMSDPQAEPQVLRGHESWVGSVAFSPDGQTLASGSDDSTIRLWDLNHSSAAPQVLRGHESSVSSVVLSPDGTTLASGSGDGTIRLWDMSDPQAEPQVLRGHESGVESVAFSPDGQSLASGSSDGTIRLWILLDELIEIGCQQVWRNLSWEEWQRYAGGQVPYHQTCPNWPIHPSVPEEFR